MIFFVPFGINQIFPGLQSAPALWACAIRLAFEKFTCIDLFQIVLIIMHLLYKLHSTQFNNINNSHHLSAWYCIDTVMRNSVLVTGATLGVKEEEEKVPHWELSPCYNFTYSFPRLKK